MTLHPPCIITARLLPGIRIGDGTLSIEHFTMDEGRTRYRVFLDAPATASSPFAPPLEYEDTQLRSGVGGGSLQDGLASFLNFLAYAVEHARYVRDHPGADDGEDPLFPQHILDWASDHEMEIQDAAATLSETLNLIQEYTP